MDNNNFDSFDDFTSDGFDGFGNDGFDSSDGFGGDPFDTSGGFDNTDSFSGQNQGGFGNDGFSDGFDDGFENNQLNQNGSQFSNNDFPENPVDNAATLSKKSYIMIAVGIGILLVVIIIASAITKTAKRKNMESSQNVVAVQEQVQEQPKQKVNADDLMSTQPQQSVQEQAPVVEQPQENNKVINNVKEGGTVWTEITSGENVTFHDTLTDMQFTITDIKHRARAVDASETLVVKTTLTGSISGLPGTYELDVPYDKGIKLEELGIGTQFTVHVQLGEYNGRTVVGNITY